MRVRRSSRSQSAGGGLGPPVGDPVPGAGHWLDAEHPDMLPWLVSR